MTEFWEASFKDKQEMWGWEAADSALSAVELFNKNELRKVLIPGFGYGRNAKVFMDRGFEVTGIEISETAIGIAKREFGDSVRICHGSVSAMPFDDELYDGIFCYALLHLLNNEDRIKLISDCYAQLKPGGYMVFVSLSKEDFRYGQGREIGKDTFEMQYGVRLFFYDADSIRAEFGDAGLVDAKEIKEPAKATDGRPQQRFWYIVCEKPV
ncbi:class I SAM-dependent methyltransferase [Pedobacter deserti]|uniref:class I SAM-dependent methyltransferase n=1 Tax=Pedobacter deserti TaxID=2817382 RepID=UPI00210CEBD4|nr:class I SAM-dependent methyltransferase [Pedobacter sp. SYSU D00382]